MKVAVLTHYFPTAHQPWAGHSAYQTLRFLAKQCDLKVFYPEAVYPSFFAPKTWPGVLDRTWQPLDVTVEYIAYHVLPMISRPLNGITMARRLRPSIAEFNPDVILSYVVYPDGWAAVQIGSELRRPVVLTAIGSDLNRISDPLSGAFTRAALRRADGIITVSQDLGRTAVNLGADRQRVYPVLNGCDIELFHPRNALASREAVGIDANISPVVYIGRTDVRKGLLELLEAFITVKRNSQNAHLYLVGDGPDKPLLEERISQSNAAAYIHLIPSCPTEQVAQWMGAAHTVVLPSYAEGCPNVVIEALCSGRPVVATNVGGIPELMNDNSGRLVLPKRVSDLANAVLSVLGQSWDSEAIAADHRRGWSDVSDDVFSILKRF